jgi:hypothetical protein
VPEILGECRLANNRKNRSTFRSALLTYIKKGKFFRKEGIGKYGLIEWGDGIPTTNWDDAHDAASLMLIDQGESRPADEVKTVSARQPHTAASVKEYIGRLKPGGAAYQTYRLYKVTGKELNVNEVLDALEVEKSVTTTNRYRTALHSLEAGGVLERVRPGVFRLKRYDQTELVPAEERGG